MKPKACKWCNAIWHSKNKCPQREIKPLKAVYKTKATNTQLKSKNPSERLILAYKGKSERSQAIGYADKYFSLYIRQRGSKEGRNICYTCARSFPIEDLQAGHFISRRFLSTRWNKLNVWNQCNYCNITKHGNLYMYEKLLRMKHGDEAIDELKRLANSSARLNTTEIEEIANHYKSLVFLE